MNLHFVTSAVNSGIVTVFTSLAMTFKNSADPHFPQWLTNWLISWAIVCAFVYWIAPRIANYLRSRF